MREEETIATLARVAEAKERLRKQANPQPVKISERPIAEEETMAAGIWRGRVLCLLDKLHRDGAITTEMWMAGNQLRQQIMAEMPPSEGVSPIYDATGRAEPSRKADRRGRRLTGFDVEHDGTIRYAGGRRSRQNLRELEDALFSACGLVNADHKRVADLQHLDILMRVCLESEKMPTLTNLTLELTDHYGAKSKQAPPFSLGKICVWLRRLSMHYLLAR